MGFLDHSTNNIILDAVLTDTGRQFLARNDGSFSVQKFALGDDEINYTIIKKYGRTVGKEKIEKNTPIFEALTGQEFSQKYRLNTISNPNLTSLPRLTLSAGGSRDLQGNMSSDSIALAVTPRTISSGLGPLLGGTTLSLTNNASIEVEQTLVSDTSIDNELRDTTFMVDLPDLFCSMQGQRPTRVDSQKRATYLLRRLEEQNSFGGSKVRFNISVKSITNSMFQIYGRDYGTLPGAGYSIRTYMRISGMQSGSVKDILLVIYQGS